MNANNITCQHCEYSKEDRKSGLLLCQRYPPQLIVLPGDGLGDYAVDSGWPTVRRDEACGEGKPIDA